MRGRTYRSVGSIRCSAMPFEKIALSTWRAQDFPSVLFWVDVVVNGLSATIVYPAMLLNRPATDATGGLTPRALCPPGQVHTRALSNRG